MTEHNKQQTIISPQHRLTLHVGIVDGLVWYSLSDENNQLLVERSHMAMYSGEENLLAVDDAVTYTEDEHDETWEQPWGEQRWVRNCYKELTLKSTKCTIRFRLFDEGLGFRYELNGEGMVTVDREATDFNIDILSHAWWIPALGGNHYEHLYRKTALGEITTAHTPLTVELAQGGFAAIHEAALYDYGAMNIVPTENGLRSAITPLKDETVAKIELPFTTPWRMILFSKTAAGLGVSKMMLNLNEPSKIEDTSWIQPTKFMGIWWAMFIGYFTWASGEKHGATTANALRYINAAKKLGISALLIEGWNETWDGDWTKNGDKMDFMQPYPDFDIHMVTSYTHLVMPLCLG